MQFQSKAIRNSNVTPGNTSESIKQLSESLYSVNEEILLSLEHQMMPLLEEFRSEGRNSPFFRFWDDYLSKVSAPLKLFISSSRHVIWAAHQYAKSKLLPFFCVSNRLFMQDTCFTSFCR